MKLKTAIFVTLLAVSLVVEGQDYYFRHYQVENGLSNNAVICSVQDPKGFLWFGTKDGLDRFDGYTFKIFRNDPEEAGSLGSNFIHSLYVDRQGVLWVGTEKGLYKYDDQTESFSWLPAPFTEQVTDIHMDTAGNLWFISNFNLFRYHEAKKQLQQFPIDSYFEATSVSSLADGSVWVSSSNGLLQQYNPASDQFTAYNMFAHSPRPVSTWIEKIYGASEGKIWVGTSNQGVKLFDAASGDYKDILTYNNDRTEIFARNFVQASAHECWIATESGIFIYNAITGSVTNLRKEYNNPYSISDNAVYTFCKDREGGIWAGTYFGGISYYSRQSLKLEKFFPDKTKNSLSGNVVREVHEDRFGNVWIGTEDAGLNKFDRKKNVFTTFRPGGNSESISYTNIHGLLATGNELWIGTFEHGLDVMNIQTGKVIRHYAKGADSNSLKSNFIYCIYQTVEGDIMLGTTIGAYKYNRLTDNFSPLAGMPLYNWYSSIIKDDKGIVWAGTYGNGLNYYNTHTQKAGNFRYDPKQKNSLASDRVNSLFKDSRNNLWVATEGGLCRLDPAANSFKRYTTENGFPTNFILSMLEDDQRNLWISTSKGLVCFNAGTEKVIVYTRANGLLSDQFNFSSAFRDKEGRMYFGSVKGLISFRPGELQNGGYTPHVYITGFQVNNKELPINKDGSPLNESITLSKKMVLTYQQSTFSIDFASLSYTAPEMSEYAYKMEGLDNDWIYLKTNRKVYFTDLSAGTYTFRVKATNSTSGWTANEASLVIQVLPPWWLSGWAYSLYVLIVIGLIYYLVRSYHHRIKERNRRRMEQLELAKEKELYEAKMEFFTNVAHEIKTPLTLIKGPLEKVVKKAGDLPGIKDSLRIMEKNTTRLVDLTNQLLDFRQTEIRGFSLSFTKENIGELVEDIFTGFKPLAEKKNLCFNLGALPVNLFAWIDVEAFTKTLTNLLGNAIKYAASKVEVDILSFKQGDAFFTIEIRNDGFLVPYEMREKIFEPFFRLKETEKQKGTGIGLALSRSLVQLHKGFLELKEAKNEMNVFSLTLPLQQQGAATGIEEVKPAITKHDNEATDITGR